jgi:adenylate kinase
MKEIEKITKPLIIEGHYAQEVISSKHVTKIFVLRKAPWKLKEELQIRGYNASKIWENIEAEIVGICLSETIALFNSKQVCEIDTTNITPESATQMIVEILEGKSSCVVGLVDWMSHQETISLIKEKSILLD